MALPNLSVSAIPTRIFEVGESLEDFVAEHVDASLIREGMILAVTSKIVSLAESRLVDKSQISKHALVDQEADHNLGEIGYGCFLTIKEGLLIPSAGIDESNSKTDQYILYPEYPFQSAQILWQRLRTRWGLESLGILLTDSHTTPLRRGVTGISLAHWGFHGLRNCIDKPDLFGRNLKMTTVNLADGLATAATLMMGEANEARPVAVIYFEDNTNNIQFSEYIDSSELRMPLEEDLYYPLIGGRVGAASL